MGEGGGRVGKERKEKRWKRGKGREREEEGEEKEMREDYPNKNSLAKEERVGAQVLLSSVHQITGKNCEDRPNTLLIKFIYKKSNNEKEKNYIERYFLKKKYLQELPANYSPPCTSSTNLPLRNSLACTCVARLCCALVLRVVCACPRLRVARGVCVLCWMCVSEVRVLREGILCVLRKVCVSCA